MEEFYKTIEVGQKVKICGIDRKGALCEAVVEVTGLYDRSSGDYGFDYSVISGRAYDNTRTVEDSELVNREVTVWPFHEEEDGYSKSHYEFDYILTEKDKEKGMIRLDPYFVSKQWGLGSKDETGIIWHCFKTIARFGVKNSKEREIKALYNQIKRLAELEGVNLDERDE